MFDIADVARQADERAAEIEATRHLPSGLAADLAATGICRAFAPRELGAAEATPAELSHDLESLAARDGSTGWCAMIAATTSIVAGWLPAEWAEEIYGPEDSVTGGFAAPMGRATVTDEGLRVSGRWAWGSGSHHCTWLGGGTLVVDAGGTPTGRADGLTAPFVFFSMDQVTLLDTWHVAGLKGTGSVDYTVTDAFVPGGRWVDMTRPARIGRPLYRMPFFGSLAIGVASVMLGLARRAIDELIGLAEKHPQGSARSLAQRAPIQADLAAAVADHRSARLLLDDAIERVWASASAGEVPGADRVALRLAATNAALNSAAAVDRCYHAAGGSAVYESSPLQRVFRDVHVATQHAMVAPRTLEVIGRHTFGLDTDLAQI